MSMPNETGQYKQHWRTMLLLVQVADTMRWI
ncbi:UNVERIFIED_ORG: hypothetical protein GGE44_004260 [Rhizobium esperanzae]